MAGIGIQLSGTRKTSGGGSNDPPPVDVTCDVGSGQLREQRLGFGLLLIVALIILFRLMRPERLVNPETFATLVLYLREMGTPGSPFLPSTWAFDGS